MRAPRWLVVACAAACLAPGGAAAQERSVTRLVLVEDGASEARARGWMRRLARDVEGSDVSLSDWADARAPVGTVEPAALAVLARVEAHLVAARRATAALEEREALRELAEAEALARRHLTLPGIAAWYAEVQLAIALTAAQAELASLSDAALLRASSIDPSRTVQLGEAPPEHVERARALQRATSGARGRFEVRADAPGAQAFLDDRPVGSLPQRVETSVGAHVLRVEAPGHRSWAALLDVLEGERPPVAVRLAPSPLRVAVEQLEAAARAGDVRRVSEGLRALPSAPPLWMLWVGQGPEDRAVLVRCLPGHGCGRAARLAAVVELGAGTEEESELEPALAWRDAEAARPVEVDEPLVERWYVWVAAGLALAAGAAAIAVAAQPEGPGPLRVEIDPTRLPGF